MHQRFDHSVERHRRVCTNHTVRFGSLRHHRLQQAACYDQRQAVELFLLAQTEQTTDAGQVVQRRVDRHHLRQSNFAFASTVVRHSVSRAGLAPDNQSRLFCFIILHIFYCLILIWLNCFN